ncbi:MAG: hypothetical protein ACQEQI_03025 [Bacillota bacterium]
MLTRVEEDFITLIKNQEIIEIPIKEITALIYKARPRFNSDRLKKIIKEAVSECLAAYLD